MSYITLVDLPNPDARLPMSGWRCTCGAANISHTGPARQPRPDAADHLVAQHHAPGMSSHQSACAHCGWEYDWHAPIAGRSDHRTPHTDWLLDVWDKTNG